MTEAPLRHRLALAVIVLALGTADAVASGGPSSAEVCGWLFRLSIEELMDISIDPLDGDSLEASARQAARAGASYLETSDCIASDETKVTPISIPLDNVDYEP